MTLLNTGFILLPSLLTILTLQKIILLIKSSPWAIVIDIASSAFFEATSYLFKDKRAFNCLEAKATKINNVGGNEHVETKILYMKKRMCLCIGR